MGLSDQDRILVKNLYLFKGYGAKKIRSSRVKVGTVGNEQTFEKDARNWHDGYYKKMQIFSAAIFPNIITIGEHLTK